MFNPFRKPDDYELNSYEGASYQPDISYEEEDAMRDEEAPYDSSSSDDDNKPNPYQFRGEF